MELTKREILRRHGFFNVCPDDDPAAERALREHITMDGGRIIRGLVGRRVESSVPVVPGHRR
jgi:hypothetical protein